MVRELLKLGNPKLYEISAEITPDEKDLVKEWIADLHDTLMEYRKTYGAGRAVAAPQIDIRKRLLYMYLDKPYVFINPVMTFPDDEKYILLDDCMSFPGLIVKFPDINEPISATWTKTSSLRQCILRVIFQNCFSMSMII